MIPLPQVPTFDPPSPSWTVSDGEVGDGEPVSPEALEERSLLGAQFAEPAVDAQAKTVPSGPEAARPGPVSAGKLDWSPSLSLVHPVANPRLGERLPSFRDLVDRAGKSVPTQTMAGDPVRVIAQDPKNAAIAEFDRLDDVVRVKPLSRTPPLDEALGDPGIWSEILDRALTLCHELSHLCDRYDKAGDGALRSGMAPSMDKAAGSAEEKVHSEYRAHATQCVVTREALAAGETPGLTHALMEAGWTKNTFAAPQEYMFEKTRGYMASYKVPVAGTATQPPTSASPPTVTDKDVRDFIAAHRAWVDEAFEICPVVEEPLLE